MRILVTGGAGFIGSHYVRTLLSGGYPAYDDAEVTVFDKLTYAGNLANLAAVAGNPRYTFIRGDICDPAAVDAVLPGHQTVINFAAETHVDRSISGPAPFALTNVVGVQTLLDGCVSHAIERVVHIGTDEVYGSIDVGAWNEDAPLLPNSPYAAAKAGAELLVRAYHRTYGLNVSSTRCSNNYGPHQFPEKVVPLFITRLIDGLKVPLYGDGNNVRDWLHVDDHCSAVQLVLEEGLAGAAYNIGGGEELTNRALTQAILDAMGADWDSVEYVEDRRGHDRRYALDDSRLRELGYAPEHAFAPGLAETIEWYRTHQDWWRPLLATVGR